MTYDGLIIKNIKDEKDIRETLVHLSKLFFNDKNKNNKVIDKLSQKYSEFGNVIVIEIKDQPLGVCAFYTNDNIEKKAYLSLIAINNNYQNQGLGTLMLNKVKEISINEGMKYLLLEVDNNNKRAIAFYEKNDFVCLQENLNSSIYGCVLK